MQPKERQHATTKHIGPRKMMKTNLHK